MTNKYHMKRHCVLAAEHTPIPSLDLKTFCILVQNALHLHISSVMCLFCINGGGRRFFLKRFQLWTMVSKTLCMFDLAWHHFQTLKPSMMALAAMLCHHYVKIYLMRWPYGVSLSSQSIYWAPPNLTAWAMPREPVNKLLFMQKLYH